MISFVVSYLIGSIPTAYIFVKITSNVDIRSAGSGNVGGRNALDVTGKKWVGVAVVLLDLLKGSAAVVVSGMMNSSDATSLSISMVSVVLGHCYPVWLGFKGGRGLATAAGVFFVCSWVWVPLWLFLYFISGKMIKSIHSTSVVALVATPLVFMLLPMNISEAVILKTFSYYEFIIAGSAVIAVCLSRHIEPIIQSYRDKSTNEKTA